MNILVVDYRCSDGCDRAEDIARRLRGEGHEVSVVPHVTGHAFNSGLNNPNYQSWSDELKIAVAGVSVGKTLILLHVGDNQRGAEAVLRECYRDHHVIAFSGGALPVWCVKDSRENKSHASIHGAIPADNQWPDWSVRQLIRACELIQSGDWASARSVVSCFDPHLEENLDALYEALKKNTSTDKLRQLREQLLGSS